MEVFMDPKMYKAAAEGDIEPLQSSGIPLDQLVTPIGNTILHVHLAAGKGRNSAEFVNQILTLCPILLSKANNISGDTPLHVAARSGDSEAVRSLIAQAKALHPQDPERGTREVHVMMSMANRRKDTALHEAARNNMISVVAMLTSEGPSLEYEANDCNESPLYLAAEGGHHHVVEEMLRTCTSISFDGPNGKTTLHAAVISSSNFFYKRNMVRLILEKQEDLCRKEDNNGWTPLHYAAYLDYSMAAKLILEVDQSTAYAAKNKRQMTALHVAGRCNAGGTVKEIISVCADCCEVVDAEGWNFVHYAAITRSSEVMRMVVKTPSLRYLLNQSDFNGKTPLHLHAASKNGPETKSRDLPTLGRTNRVIIRSQPEEEKAYVWLQGSENAPMGEVFNIWDGFCYEEYMDTMIQRIEKSRDVYLIVASLIATVAFAAAFTVPGGFISDSNNPKQGTPVLLRNKYFQWFIVYDIVAMVFSTSCILTNLLISIAGHDTKRWLITCQLVLLSTAQGAVAATFFCGLSAVMWHSPWLEIAATLSACSSVVVLALMEASLLGKAVLLNLLRQLFRLLCMVEKTGPGAAADNRKGEEDGGVEVQG